LWRRALDENPGARSRDGFHHGLLENGINTNFAKRPVDEADNIMPSLAEMDTFFNAPANGDSLTGARLPMLLWSAHYVWSGRVRASSRS
jgi:hypothetical protein